MIINLKYYNIFINYYNNFQKSWINILIESWTNIFLKKQSRTNLSLEKKLDPTFLK